MNTITFRDVIHAANRDAILQWVRDHGLDPNEVRSITTIGPLIRAEVYVLDEDGYKQRDPRRGDRALMRTRWRWLKRRLPSATLDTTVR